MKKTACLIASIALALASGAAAQTRQEGAAAAKPARQSAASPKMLTQLAPTSKVNAQRCEPDSNNPTCVVEVDAKDDCSPYDKTQLQPEDLHVRAVHGTKSLVRFDVKSKKWKFAATGGITF